MIKESLLKARSEIKSRKPNFIRQDSHKKKRLTKKWKKPKGLQSKLRYSKGPHGMKVEVGYKLPESLKGIVKGLRERIVYNKFDLSGFDANIEGALVSGSVGKKNKLEILKEAISKGITVLNVKDPQLFIKSAEEDIKNKKELKKKEQQKKEEVKKKVEKKKEEPKLNAEEREKKEKAEKDKVLTKRS